MPRLGLLYRLDISFSFVFFSSGYFYGQLIDEHHIMRKNNYQKLPKIRGIKFDILIYWLPLEHLEVKSLKLRKHDFWILESEKVYFAGIWPTTSKVGLFTKNVNRSKCLSIVRLRLIYKPV
mgnify:CR=1 FL=1